MTSPDTVAAVAAHAMSLGKVPLVVSDGPGFVVNRLLLAYINSALDRLVDGLEPAAIDAVATDFGMAMGPLRQLDEIGLDTAVASGVAISEVIEPRAEATALLVALVKAKQLGIKSARASTFIPENARTLL